MGEKKKCEKEGDGETTRRERVFCSLVAEWQCGAFLKRGRVFQER